MILFLGVRKEEEGGRRMMIFGVLFSKDLCITRTQCTDEKKIVDLSFWVTVTF